MNTPTTDKLTKNGLSNGNNTMLTLDLYGLAKSLESALRTVMDTPQFYDMADSVQAKVRIALGENADVDAQIPASFKPESITD